MTVTFLVEGGFTGLRSRAVLESDGTCRLDRGGIVSEKQVGAATVQDAVAALDRSGLFDEDREYPALGADLRRYEVVHRGVTVVCHDTSVPPELAPGLELLLALASA